MLGKKRKGSCERLLQNSVECGSNEIEILVTFDSFPHVQLPNSALQHANKTLTYWTLVDQEANLTV